MFSESLLPAYNGLEGFFRFWGIRQGAAWNVILTGGLPGGFALAGGGCDVWATYDPRPTRDSTDV